MPPFLPGVPPARIILMNILIGRCSTDGTDRSFSLLFPAHKCTGLLKLSRLQRLVGAFSESARSHAWKARVQANPR